MSSSIPSSNVKISGLSNSKFRRRRQAAVTLINFPQMLYINKLVLFNFNQAVTITLRLITFSVDVTVIVEVLVTKELDVTASTWTGPYATKRIAAVNAIKAKWVEILWRFMLEMSVQFRDFASSVTQTLSHHPVIYAQISTTKEPQDNSTCWPIRPAWAHF